MASLALLLPLASCTAPAPAVSSSTPPSPVASASPASGPDLVWLLDAQQSRHYILIDWTGGQVGDLNLDGQVLPSPDGRRALLNAAMVIDATGGALGALQVGEPDVRDVVWADDSRHLCVIAQPATVGPDTGSSSLWLAQPGRPARRIAGVGRPGSNPGITACSIATDRAVIVSDFSAHIPPPQGVRYLLTALVQVIALSTGAVLYQHDYVSGPSIMPPLLSSSPDGHYLVENFIGSAVLRDVVTGRAVETLSGENLAGFSWDGTREMEKHAVGGTMAVKVVDRASAAVLWQQVVDLDGLLPHRKASEIMFSIASAGGGGGDDIYLLPAVGPARLVARNVFLVSACPCVGSGSGA